MRVEVLFERRLIMYKTISIDELQEKYKNENLNILDVREEDEYEEAHIPGATNIPLSNIDQELTKLDKDKEYVVHCQAGSRSKKASDILEEQGYQVTNVSGGMKDWDGEVE